MVSFIAKYAIIGVVLKDWRFSQALKLSWKLFTRNWLLSLEIAIVLFGIYFLATSFLLWLLFLIFVYSLKIFIGFTFGLPLVWLILLSVFIVIQIVLAIFHWATWAIVFELLTAPKTVLASWLSRKFKSLPPAD